MRIGVIINPGSGRRTAAGLRTQVEQIGADAGAKVTLAVYDGSERIESLALRLVTEVDVIGVAGGDGTLNGAINGVMASRQPETPLFFLPAGRGGDTSRTIPSLSLTRAAIRSFAYRTRQVDLGVLSTSDGETRYFINESSIGLGGFAARSANRLPRRLGSSVYLLAALDGIARCRPCQMRLEIDGVGVVDLPRCHHLTIANGRYFGGGLQIAPLASPEDGLLDIIAVADASPFEVAIALPRLLRSTHLGHPKVHHWKSTAVAIEGSTDAVIETDGEASGSVPARYSVVHNALTWVEPL